LSQGVERNGDRNGRHCQPRPGLHDAKSTENTDRRPPESGSDVPKSPAASPSAHEAPNLLPSVTLPKGGGAIRDIGEKFSVNAATGTGRIVVPGAEDLVPVLDANGVRKHLRPPRTVHGITYDISFYRPRTEGLFSRIERWVALDTGVTHWRTISRDNVTVLYGYDAASRIADPNDATKIFSWRISRSWDTKGNVAAYEYGAEDSAGIDSTAAHEVNRSKSTRGNQTYLSSIRYCNLQPYFPDWSAGGAETSLPTD
jgi:hypothetical protein